MKTLNNKATTMEERTLEERIAAAEEAKNKASKELEELEEAKKAKEAAEKAEELEENNDNTDSNVKFFKNALSVFAVIGIFGILIMLVLMYNAKSNNNGDTKDTTEVVDTNPTTETTNNSAETKQPGTDVPEIPVVSQQFDMDKFVAGATKIAKSYTDDENIGLRVSTCCLNIGEKKLAELIETYDEKTVQKLVAAILSFGSEAKMKQYIAQNDLDYNPNADIDYSEAVQVLNDIYYDQKHINADGALMAMPGYDDWNGNRDALRKMIKESGDEELLTWYNSKMVLLDTMYKQMEDTEKALEYKKTVETEILESDGLTKLLTLLLEEEAKGMLFVDYDSMSYTEDFYNFIVNNYNNIIVAG